jgi:hypothetical protein
MKPVEKTSSATAHGDGRISVAAFAVLRVIVVGPLEFILAAGLPPPP